MNALQRDKCYGRRLVRTGAAQMVITRFTARVPTPSERAMFWRWRSGNPGLGNAHFTQPVESIDQHSRLPRRSSGPIPRDAAGSTPAPASIPAAADAARQPSPAGDSLSAVPAGVSSAAGNLPEPEDTP